MLYWFACRQDMTAIFISYRRSTERQSAMRLRDRMAQYFDVEDLFLDSESIMPGDDWSDSLSMAIGTAKACLVIIGPNWLAARDEQGRQRLFQEDDWVRREIEIALSSPRTRLIPVLVQGATLPAEQDLPSSIQGLLEFQVKPFDEDHWEADCRELVRRVHDVTGHTKLRERMNTVLIALILGILFSLANNVVEMETTDAKIDSHLSYLAALVAAGFVLFGRSFLINPLKSTLGILRLIFGLMLCLQLGAFGLSVLIWGREYDTALRDGILIVVLLVAAASFLKDAGRMVKRRS